MTRHGLAEILLMVLALCGALAILSLIGTGLLRVAARSTPPGSSGVAVSSGGISVWVFSVFLLAVVAIVIAVRLALKSRH
jgi:hypothetical protein